ncbi:hypothetical protein ABZ319_26245 [Nocardia sp. NPDC005978]|uniref:hypothetical protein n=1 Tax=Nocardia sp. NPDC005978 TaxID=3156725 RepID=UPI0033BAC621
MCNTFHTWQTPILSNIPPVNEPFSFSGNSVKHIAHSRRLAECPHRAVAPGKDKTMLEAVLGGLVNLVGLSATTLLAALGIVI